MLDTPSPPGQTPFDAATQWLATTPEALRDTVLRHWKAHRVDHGQQAGALRVDTLQQAELAFKAIREHYSVLAPTFLHHLGRRVQPAGKGTLSAIERQVIGDDDAFLRAHTRLCVLGMRDGYGTVVLDAPGFVDRAEATRYAKSLFGDAPFTVGEKPTAQGNWHILMPVYDFKRAADMLAKPVGYRALPHFDARQRTALEDEYRRTIGLHARPKERDIEALIQDLGITQAVKELTRDYRVMFSDSMKDGVYTLALKDPASPVAKGAQMLIASGTFSPDDAFMLPRGNGKELYITPSALLVLEEALMHGIKGKTGQQASILSPEAVAARARHFAQQRLDGMRHELVRAQLAQMDAPARERVRSLLGTQDITSMLAQGAGEGPVKHAALEVLSRTVESVAAHTDSSGATPRYDQVELRAAIARGRALLAEPNLWQAHENSQLFSGHNAIRTAHDEALADLDALLASQSISQRSIGLLINTPRFADAIRDTGHFLAVVQDAGTKGYDNGATQFQQAFHLSRAALTPRSADAKAASYHMRSDIGKVGAGEMLGNNLFMGVKPILSSVDLMFKKPMLVGGAILGIVGYSAVAPKKYQVATFINGFTHRFMEAIGMGHSHDVKGADLMKRFEKMALDEGKGSHFRMGVRMGVMATAGTAAAAFVGFNLIEDPLVHIPLAVGGVGVGAVGGATGRKVLAPVFNEVGDIAGRFTPEAVRQSVRHDKALLKKAADTSWIGRVAEDAKQFTRDIDEFGLIATGHHAVDATQRSLGRIYRAVMGEAPEKAPAR